MSNSHEAPSHPAPAFVPFPDDGSGYDTDVVVVGLGPAGGIAAVALATYGVRVHAVTMFPWVANSPRAHITNQRAVEVLRDLGLESDARKQATPWDQMGDTMFTTSLAGEEILRLQTWGTGEHRHGRLPPRQPVRDARPAPAADGAHPHQQGRRTRRHRQLQHRVPRPRTRRHRRSPCGSATSAPARSSPSAPATCSGSMAPAPASPSSSSCPSRASSPAPAPPTSCSTPTCRATSSTGRASCTGSSTPRPASARSGWGCCAPSSPGTSGSPAGASTWPPVNPTSTTRRSPPRSAPWSGTPTSRSRSSPSPCGS